MHVSGDKSKRFIFIFSSLLDCLKIYLKCFSNIFIYNIRI